MTRIVDHGSGARMWGSIAPRRAGRSTRVASRKRFELRANFGESWRAVRLVALTPKIRATVEALRPEVAV